LSHERAMWGSAGCTKAANAAFLIGVYALLVWDGDANTYSNQHAKDTAALFRRIVNIGDILCAFE